MRSPLSTVPAGIIVPTFPQRSPPWLLTTAACGGLGSAPDRRTRRALLHLSYSCAAPFGPAMLVTQGRVGMWRGGGRLGLAGAAPFVRRCFNSRAMTPFPHPSHRTGRADFPHPALGQDFTPSPTARCTPIKIDAGDVVSRRGTGLDSTGTHCIGSCTCCATTDATASSCSGRAHDRRD